MDCLNQIAVKIMLVLIIINHPSFKKWGSIVFSVVMITRTSKQLGKYYDVLVLSHSAFENQTVSFVFIFLLHCFNSRVTMCPWS